MKVLVTGAAGFIGSYTAKALLAQGHEVLGFDGVNSYYDPSLKELRLKELEGKKGFRLVRGQLEDQAGLETAWKAFEPDHVVHLAAQVGVRYSLENPDAYISANIVGFQNVIELVRKHRPKNFIYASSSSVYGGNKSLPFSESQKIDNPISLYAATKTSNELVARTYANLFQLPSTGLRFFTVYGPASRPDMAMFKFAELMRQGKKIPVFNGGNMIRDFTYVDDIVAGILKCIERPVLGEVYNLGRGMPMNLMDMIRFLEKSLGIKADLDMQPMHLGDMEATLADVSKAKKDFGYEPKTSLEEGVRNFGAWFKKYRGL